MAFFPGSFLDHSNTISFAPFFRLLDDFETHGRGCQPQRRQVRLISPKFDVRELADSYELHGEFPGLDQNNISLEFTDTQTLTVRAHSERETTQTNAPAVEQTQAAPALTESNDDSASTKSLNATVEDDENEDGVLIESNEKGKEAEQSEPQTEQPQATALPEAQPEAQPEPQQPKGTYHAYERSVGQFYRQFTFPGRIDQDAVTASMKNGILSVVIPKAKKHEARRIIIG